MIKTNSKSTSRLLEEACCWFKGFLYSKTLLLFALLLLPAMIFAQSNKQLSEKEANNQAYMEAIYGNKPEAVQAKQVKEVKQIQEQKVATEVVETLSYQNLLSVLNIDEAKMLNSGMTKAQIEAYMLAAIDSIENPSNATPVAARQANISDTCAGADTLYCSEGVSQGSTVGFANDSGTSPRCGGPISTSGGVWYKILGNGEPTQVALSNAFAGSFLQLYNGGCGALACNTDSNNGQGTQNLAFNTVDGQEYWVLVTGQGNNEGAFDIEAFNFSCSGPIGDGLSSASAFPISCGDVANGDTTGASPTEVPPFCGTTGNGFGVWYTITASLGTPEDMTASLCGSSYDTKLNVFSGAPGSLVCVGGNDDSCGLQSQVSWTATLDETYYIYVSGFGSGQGLYTFNMQCGGDVVTPPPSAPNNDVCATPTELECNTPLTDQTTVAATNSDSITCAGTIGNDVWYTIDGTGDTTVLTLQAVNDDSPQVEVYEAIDNCGDFTVGSCYAFSFGGSSTGETVLGFSTSLGNVYYVRVGHWLSSGNDFDFSIEAACIAPATNDDCDDAVAVFCGDSIVGTTVGASAEGLPACFTTVSTAPGLWYSHTGNGQLLTISLADSTYDTKLGLYSGTCDALVCIQTDDDGGPGLTSEITIQSVLGEAYLIYVTGFGNAAGSFTLDIICQDDPCETAQQISCADSVVFGNNSGANGTSAGPTLFCGTSPDSPGVFYEFIGNDQFVNITTCDSSFDTKLNVYSGSCGALDCLTGNDDAPFGTCSLGLRSQVNFFANLGESYFIWVSGFSGQTGDFQLNITCQNAVANDLCEEAVAIGCGDSITGSTELSTRRDAPFEGCGDATAENGVWYTVVGQGGDLVASTCDAATFDTQIIIYTGTCDDLTCYAANDDGAGCSNGSSEVQFFGEFGVTYYIYVSGFGDQRGEYTLTLDCVCFTDNTGAECVTLYDGYTAAFGTATLTGELLGTDGAVTYAWSTGATTQSITVNAADGTQQYAVVMTDEYGCSSTQEFFVLSVDVDCDRGNSNKVEICHNGNTICVNENAVQSHLNHGDTLGACGTQLCDELIPLCDVSPVSPADGEVDVPANVTIQWSSATGVVDGYLISIGTSSGSDDVVSNFDVGNALSYDANLGNLTTYYYTITPYNANGSASGCSEFSFTTVNDPTRNDVCSGAIGLTVNDEDSCAVTYSADHTLFSDSGSGFSCDGFDDIDSFYTFTAPSGGEITMQTSNGTQTGTPGWAIFDSCNGTQVFCVNNTATTQTVSGLTPGTTYTLAVWYDGFTVEGTFDICLGTPPPPAPAPVNDECANAIALTVNADQACGTVTAGTIEAATNSGVNACGGTEDDDVWYSFVATATEHRVSLINITGGTSDLYHAIFAANNCGSLGAAIRCSDPNTSNTSGLTIGQNYYVQVYSWTSTPGQTSSFDICIGTPAGPPANDDPSGAVALSVSTSCVNTVGTNESATATAGVTAPGCAAYSGGDVWFTATTVSGTMTIETSTAGGFTDSGMAVYTGTPGSLTLVECDDDDGPGLFSNITYVGSPGDTVYIRVWEFGNNAFGSFNICATDAGARMANPELVWTMYPNPSKGQVNLDLTDFRNNDINVQVIDLRGNVILRRSVKNLQDPKLQIELNNVPYGVYMVRVQSNDNVSTKRLIISN